MKDERGIVLTFLDPKVLAYHGFAGIHAHATASCMAPASLYCTTCDRLELAAKAKAQHAAHNTGKELE